MGANGVGGWDRTTVRRLTGARSTFELHRQTGGAVAPPPYRFSVVTDPWARRPRGAAPPASRLGEASRGQGGAAVPAPRSGRSRRRACLPASPRRPSSERRAGGARSPAPIPARRARVGRSRPEGARGTGGRDRTCIDGFRGRRPAIGPLRYVFVDSGGVEPPVGRLRGGSSTVERRVHASRPGGTRTPILPLKRRMLSL